MDNLSDCAPCKIINNLNKFNRGVVGFINELNITKPFNGVSDLKMA